MASAISTHDLSKWYPKPSGWRRLAWSKAAPPDESPASTKLAVDRVNLTVQRGELFGLLGPNGAGKTTLVKMLATLILPSSGGATIGDYSLTAAGQIRQTVGLVVSDERSFYWRLSGRRNLEFFAAMHQLTGQAARQRIHHVLSQVDLLSVADQPFNTYSSGLRQRLAIARSLLHQPQILFLDEPSRSLDPTATVRLHRLILDLLARDQVTIFLITHDLLEAEKLCQRVAVMHRGRIQVVGSPAELRHRLRPQLLYTVRVSPLPVETAESLAHLVPELTREPAGDYERLTFRATETDGRLAAVLDCLRENQVQLLSVDGQPPTLEEVFAHYTGDSDPNEVGVRD